MRKRKGFTLIELLAVIVILAILMVIAIPKILKVIDKSKENAALESGKLYVKAVNQYMSFHELDANEYPFVKTNDDIYSVEYLSSYIKLSGDRPTSGSLTLVNSVINADLCINGYNVLYENKNYSLTNNDKCGVAVNSGSNTPVVKNNYVVKNSIDDSFFYRFDNEDNTSSALKDKFGGEDASISGATNTNYGLYLDGINDYVAIRRFDHNNFTVEISFMLNKFSSVSQNIFANYEFGGFGIYVDGGKLATSIRDGETYEAIQYNDVQTNKLYVVQLTLTNNKYTFYVNGEKIGETDIENYTKPTDNTILIAGANPYQNTGTSEFFDGYIYSLRGYSTVLTMEELTQNRECDVSNFSNMENKLDRNLYVKYDTLSTQNTSSTLKDLSGNNHDGILSGTTVTNNGILFNGDGELDGVISAANNSSIFALTSVFSVYGPTGDTQSIVSDNEDGGCSIDIDSATNKVRSLCMLSGNYRTIYSKNAIEYNKVYVASVTYDGYYLRLYLNGEFQSEYKDYRYDFPESNTVLALGVNPVGTTPQMTPLYGAIYYADVYKRSLNNTEVAILHDSLLPKYKNKSINKTDVSFLVHYDASSNQNTSSALKNLTGNPDNGILHGPVVTANGLHFDGTDDWVYVKDMQYPKFTWIANIYLTDNITREADVIANWEYGGCGIFIDSGNALGAECRINGSYRKVEALSQLSLNTDYKVAFTFDGSKLTLYVNDVYQNSYESTYPISYGNVPTILGANPYSSDGTPDSAYYFGNIKSIKIFREALTLDEIKNN